MRPTSESSKYIIISLIILYFITSNVSACLLLNEIYPNPEDAKNEWLEIRNNCNMTINLSNIKINDSSSFSKQLNGLTTDTFVVVANRQDLFEAVFGTVNFTVVNLSYGSPWMNNGGDTIYMLNVTTLLDNMTYISSVTGHSWSLCNDTWTETENATPGYPNDCTSYEEFEDDDDGNTTESANESSNATETPDYSDISIETEGTVEQARFGDFSIVSAVLSTGPHKVKLRIAAYIYSPRWASVDLSGDTLRVAINESEMVQVLETQGKNETYILKLPLLIRKNCDGDYGDGMYTGYARVYEWETGEDVDKDKFNITLKGTNQLFCTECPECKETRCSCSSSSGTTATKDGKSDLIELISFMEEVEAGVPFETKVRIENADAWKQIFSVYAYAYDGSRCISLGFDGDAWKKTWTANKHSFELTPGKSINITLKNAFENGTNPGIYTFRVRLKYMGKDVDITRAIKVLAAPEPKVEEDFEIEIITEEEEAGPPITGMVTGRESDGVSATSNWYDTLVSWLLSIFKF